MSFTVAEAFTPQDAGHLTRGSTSASPSFSYGDKSLTLIFVGNVPTTTEMASQPTATGGRSYSLISTQESTSGNIRGTVLAATSVSAGTDVATLHEPASGSTDGSGNFRYCGMVVTADGTDPTEIIDNANPVAIAQNIMSIDAASGVASQDLERALIVVFARNYGGSGVSIDTPAGCTRITKIFTNDYVADQIAVFLVDTPLNRGETVSKTVTLQGDNAAGAVAITLLLKSLGQYIEFVFDAQPGNTGTHTAVGATDTDARGWAGDLKGSVTVWKWAGFSIDDNGANIAHTAICKLDCTGLGFANGDTPNVLIQYGKEAGGAHLEGASAGYWPGVVKTGLGSPRSA